MKRRLLNLLTLLSLLMCVAVAALWVRSYRVVDQVSWEGVTRSGALVEERTWGIEGERGEIIYGWTVNAVTFEVEADAAEQCAALAAAGGSHRATRGVGKSAGEDFWNRLGFGGYSSTLMAASGQVPVGSRRVATRHELWRGVWLAVPYWAVLGLMAIAPTVWLARIRSRGRDRRRGAGLCSSCGYDLRASPDRCPECGSPRKSRRVASISGRAAAS